MAEELKPRECPLCGLEGRAQENGRPTSRFWECVCDDCDFCGPAAAERDEAIAAWNRRPAEDAQSATIARLSGRVAELEDRNSDLEESLFRVQQWSEAYPLDIFPEPDFRKARELLEAGGMTLDSVSASCMRRVVEGVGKIARAALKGAS